jgi:hypothetical protein
MALAVGAYFAPARRPLDVAAVQSTGSPSPPRLQAASTLSPPPVTGNAPWALSALPECFEQTGEAHGSRAFVLAHIGKGLRRIALRGGLRSADCELRVEVAALSVVRGSERMRVPALAGLYADAAVAWGLPAYRTLAVVTGGKVWTLRRYRTRGAVAIFR